MRKEDLWFNWAPSSNLPPANQAVNTTPNIAVAIPTTPLTPLPAIPGRNTGVVTPNLWTPTNVSCNACQNGSPVGIGMFPAGQCPPGSSTSHNPCASSQSSSVTCYNCVNGVSQGRSYMNMSVCPPGETTDANLVCTPPPPQSITCYECSSDGQSYPSSYPNTTTCPAGTSPNPTTNCPISGCTDPSSINYNPLANTDDNSCQYPVVPPVVPEVPTIAPPPDVFGCRDPKANNYDVLANIDGEPCDYTITPTTPVVPETGKIGGMDDKTLMYIGIGVVALLLLKK